MKPSFDERKKYVNVKHILCVLDADEAVRLKKVQELRKAMEKNENCDESDVGKSASMYESNWVFIKRIIASSITLWRETKL